MGYLAEARERKGDGKREREREVNFREMEVKFSLLLELICTVCPNTQPRDGHYRVPQMCTYFNVYNYWTSNLARYVDVSGEG